MDASFGSSTGRRPVDLALEFPIVAALAAAVVFVHFPDYFRTIVSANEGLYAVVAREVVNGHLPYITAWEAKPPLFFFVLALAMRVSGVSLLALHLASTVAGFFTAYFVYRIGVAFGDDGERIGIFAAILTVALSASNKGTSAEAEVFVSAFITAAFASIAPALAGRTMTLRNAFFAAMFAGCAIEMKVTAVPSSMTAAVFAILASPAPMRAFVSVIAGVSVPIAASILPYVFVGRTDAFVDANFSTVVRRTLAAPVHPHLYELLRWELNGFFPAWLLAPLAFAQRWKVRDRSLGAMLVTWTISAVISLAAVREYFGYHFITLIPPVCLLAAWGFYRTWKSPRAHAFALVIAALTFLAHGAGRYLTLLQPDQEAQTAAILRHLIAHRSGSLYVAEGDPALYVLTNEPIPTRFPYPQHLYAPDMQIATNVDGVREARRIFAAPPQYVVMRPGRENPNTAELQVVKAILGRDYSLLASSGEYRIYVHRPG